MPTYDYLCQECLKPFEIRLSIAEYSDRKFPCCPHCGSRAVIRRFTPINLATASRTGSGRTNRCDPSAGPGCCD